MISFSQSVSSLQSLMFRQRTTESVSRQLLVAETEIATGRYADVFASLGTRATEAMSMRTSFERLEGQIQSNTFLQNKLDTTATTLGNLRDTAQEVLTLAITNSDPTSGNPQYLQQAARTAYDAIAGYLNTNYNGNALFSGVDTDRSPVNPWDRKDGATGLSPSDVLAGVTGGTVTDAADAAAKLAEINAIFDGTTANPDTAFEESFYNGTPHEDGSGNANPRLAAIIDDGIRVDYGVQANDDAFRDVLKGLALLASADPSDITDDGAYAAWVGAAVGALQTGVSGVLSLETRTGTYQGQIEDTISRQETRRDLLSTQISELEGVDPYEAATRLSALETQLQASYAVTARLQNLSFVNFMY